MSRIISAKHANQQFWGDNCSAFVLAESGSLSIKQELMPPGTRERLHRHNHSNQFFYILRGEAEFNLDDDSYQIREQEGIYVVKGEWHFIANKSTAQLEFLVISQPSIGTDRVELSIY